MGDLGWGLRTRSPSDVPGDAGVTGPETTL